MQFMKTEKKKNNPTCFADFFIFKYEKILNILNQWD